MLTNYLEREFIFFFDRQIIIFFIIKTSKHKGVLGHTWYIQKCQRVAYSAFLMATPRLMEPVYYVEVNTSVY